MPSAQKIRAMKIISKTVLPSGRRHIFLFGAKIASYQKHEPDKIIAQKLDEILGQKFDRPFAEIIEQIRNSAPPDKSREIYDYIDWQLSEFAHWISDPDGIGGLNAKLRTLRVSDRYKEIFFEMRPGDICIDCGANRGKFINAARHCGGTVYAFEPNPILFYWLQRRFGNDESVHLYNAAVGAADGTATFYRYPDRPDDEAGNIVGVFEDGQSAQETQVRVMDLTTFLQREIIDRGKQVYLLKIDIEGAEFDVLPRLIETGTYKCAKYIGIETHARFIPDGPARLARMEKLIAGAGATNIDLYWV